ncbi:Fc.00g080240.m01.CDS01 [Cosmosporella sp. VM-42]
MPIQSHNSSIPTSFATCSVWSKEQGDLPEKLKAISEAGFDAIELSMPDLLQYGKRLNGLEPDEKDYATISVIAKEAKDLADALGLKVLMLQPFANFEGWGKGSEERKDAFERARGWLRIMEAVGTDMLQIGSSDAKGISTSFDDLAADLAELADIFAEKGFRIAYENWCWATRAPTWKTVWEIVKKADRPNIGLCLDTFQSAGGEFGDPTTATGFVDTVAQDELSSNWRDSLEELSRTVPANKIYLLQISDAYRMDPPMSDMSDKDQPARSRWSHDYRPLPCDGGYLPVGDFLKAVLCTGFRGWLSVEVFDSLQDRTRTDPSTYTTAAMRSLQELLRLSS